jgi:hypothetical protein
MTVDALLALAADFARRRTPFDIPGLKLAALGGFVALVADQPVPALDALARDCIREFDPFRAPAEAGEIEKRRRSGLTPRQDEMLLRWGYPYVMDEFRFHITLTGKLSPAQFDAVWPILDAATRSWRGHELPVRDLVVFSQADRVQPFRVLARFRLGGA